MTFFTDSGPTAPAGARISTNDHLAFVKVVGPWNDEMSVRMEESNGYSDMDQNPDLDRSLTLTQRLDILKSKMDLYFKWYALANISTILQEQTSNPAQLQLLSTAPYDSDSECLKWKLLAEMGAFSAGLSSKSYKRYDKSALMCLHMNPMGIESSTEGDGTTGWWLPLNQNFIAWRAMAYQQPMSKFMLTTGLTSMSIDFGNLNVVFKGTQKWRSDVEGLDFKNMQLDIAPPNTLPDMRPQPPALPMEPAATLLQMQFKNLPNDTDLPWLPRKQLCSKRDFEIRFANLTATCKVPINPTEPGCPAAFATFYPCFNFLLRPSKRHDHGMDGMIEFSILLHIMSESPSTFWRELAKDKPWRGEDAEFAQALDILGLEIE